MIAIFIDDIFKCISLSEIYLIPIQILTEIYSQESN